MVRDYLRLGHDAIGRKETTWVTLWEFDSPSAPCYHCNPIDPKFGKEKKPEKEPGVLYLQANTVRLNPVSNSEIKIAFTFEKPKGWISVPATPSTASIHRFDIRST